MMQTTRYIIYWMETCQENSEFMQPRAWSTTDMLQAMSKMEQLRKLEAQDVDGVHGIAMHSSVEGSVGKAGVDSIVDGMCPDGVPYYWVKRRVVRDAP